MQPTVARLATRAGRIVLAVVAAVAAVGTLGCGNSASIPTRADTRGDEARDGSAQPSQEGKRPDVLFIAIDDVSPRRLGCYGNTVCLTPNMDRFAESGIRFDNAHTSPACNPSRTSVLLALRPESTGAVENVNDWRRLPGEILTMPAHFRRHGYETIRCGKIFHAGRDGEESWSRVIGPRSGLPKVDKERRPLRGPGVESDEELKAARGTGRRGEPFRYGPSGLDDMEEPAGMIAHQVIQLFNENSDAPRLIALGFRAPHLPFTAPDSYFEMYPPDDMPLPDNPGSDDSGMPLDPYAVSRFDPNTPEQWREAIAAHYACISFVDAQIGLVLDALETAGLRNNTIVVIWSDHGFMLGEHHEWRKSSLYNESTGVVLLMRAPGVTTPGSVCSRPVESIDIFPTLFDLCGIPQPPGVEAISMRPILKKPDSQWKRGALMRNGLHARSIVTGRWRLNAYSHRPVPFELFDRRNDPYELHNLATASSHSETVEELLALLEGGWKACLPPSS
jgi:uncharacterized sulfatase